jgi:hypothetical protein
MSRVVEKRTTCHTATVLVERACPGCDGDCEYYHEIFRYLQTAAFRQRCKRLHKRILKDGERPSFEEIAKELQLPLDIVIGGFWHSMQKNGYVSPPAETVQ